MIAKRITALLVMAMISTVAPAVYQKSLEPRLGALESIITFTPNGFQYQADRSGPNLICYKAWIEVQNPHPYDVILSQLDMDIYFPSENPNGQQVYKKIGTFNTTQDYTIPAAAAENPVDSQMGAIASFYSSTGGSNNRRYDAESQWGTVSPTTGTTTDVEVFAYVYLSTQYPGNATNEAIAELLRTGSITVQLQGDLIIGPLQLPFSQSGVVMNLNIWGQQLTILDVVGAYDSSTLDPTVNNTDLFYVDAQITNPSGNPFALTDYTFNLRDNGIVIAQGINSGYMSKLTNYTTIYDPDFTEPQAPANNTVRVPLKDVVYGSYHNNTINPSWGYWDDTGDVITRFGMGQTTANMLLPLDFTGYNANGTGNATLTDANLHDFLNCLLVDGTIDQNTGHQWTLAGTGKIILGTTNGLTVDGISVNFGGFGSYDQWQAKHSSNPDDSSNMQLKMRDDMIVYQHDSAHPYNIQDSMTLGNFNVTNIDVNSNTNEITLTANSTVNFVNPYRIDMNFTNFMSDIYYDNKVLINASTDLFASGTEARTIYIERAHGYYINVDDIYPSFAAGINTYYPAGSYKGLGNTTYPNFAASPGEVSNTTTIFTNLTIGYNTTNFDMQSGLGQIYQDIGFLKNGQLQTFNLTNPFGVLGPNGVQLSETGTYPDWMQLMDYLIQNQVDPLMLLHQVQTDYETHFGTNAYLPLQCSTFGNMTNTVNGLGQILEPADFPSTDSSFGGVSNFNKPYHTPFEFATVWGGAPLAGEPERGNWSSYWNEAGLNEYTLLNNIQGTGNKLDDYTKNNWVFATTYGGPLGGGNPDYFNALQGSLTNPAYWDWGDFSGGIWSANGITSTATQNPATVSTPLYSSVAHYGEAYNLFPQNLAWRLSTGGDGVIPPTGSLGYNYDFTNLEKGYFLATDGNWVFARQNISLAMPLNLTDPSIQVTKATLSISYKFPQGFTGPTTGPFAYLTPAYLGISSWSGGVTGVGAKQYIYQENLPGQVPQVGIGDGVQGPLWNLPNPGDKDWSNYAVDVTPFIQGRLAAMAAGQVNASKVEVGFGTNDTTSSPVLTYFDDAYLSIDYINTTQVGTLQPADLLSYIETNNPTQGNLYNMMDNAKFNATNFVSFLEGTLGHNPRTDGQPGISFVDAMAQSGVQAPTMPSLLENNFTQMGGAEPTNFLQLLNETEYSAVPYSDRPADDNATGRDVVTSLGIRDPNAANWVLQDPLSATQAWGKALLSSLYFNPSTNQFVGSDSAGQELWNMLGNLGVNLPWVCMYLIEKGWTKNQIFDLLEAIGLGSNVRRATDPTYATDSGGALRVEAYLHIMLVLHWNVFGIASGTAGPFSIGGSKTINGHDYVDSSFKLDMGQTLTSPYTELLFALSGQGTSSDVLGDGSQIAFAVPLQVATATMPDSQVDADATSFSSSQFAMSTWPFQWGYIDQSSLIGIKSYTLGLWLQNKGTGSAYMPDTWTSGSWNQAYLQDVPVNGLTQGGIQQVFQNYRANVKFQGSTFLDVGGNPVSLFQFLDSQYFFPTSGTNTDGSRVNTKASAIDQSSYTLLNAFNAKAIDFLDIITNYNRTANQFDTLGDGKCNEWTAPTSARYWEGSTYYNPSLPGFGYNFQDSRIFDYTKAGQAGLIAGYGTNSPQDLYAKSRDNTIMWTDSPNLAITGGAQGQAHEAGNVYLGAGTFDNFDAGAPPMANLIDMLAWLSLVTGKPDPTTLMQWLTGNLTDSAYSAMGVGVGSKTLPLTVANGVRKGLGGDNTWTFFKNITMNGTGMVNYIQQVRGLDPWQYFYLMNQTQVIRGSETYQAFDPMQLLEYATTPNLSITAQGGLAFVFHNAIGATSSVATENFWKVLNSTWWYSPTGGNDQDPMFNLAAATPQNQKAGTMFPALFYGELSGFEQQGLGLITQSENQIATALTNLNSALTSGSIPGGIGLTDLVMGQRNLTVALSLLQQGLQGAPGLSLIQLAEANITNGVADVTAGYNHLKNVEGYTNPSGLQWLLNAVNALPQCLTEVQQGLHLVQSYNVFLMYQALGIDPVSWVNTIMADTAGKITPLEMYGIYNTLNYTAAITANSHGSALIESIYNIDIEVNNMDVSQFALKLHSTSSNDSSVAPGTSSSFNALLSTCRLYADVAFQNFIDPWFLTGTSYNMHH